jgi:hypothetical protein
MNFFTRIDVPAADFKIDYTSHLAFFGSCFADNISAQFAERKFKVMANPFGTVYNPVSLASQIEAIADGKVFGEEDVFQDTRCDGLWHCWNAHSSLSGATKEECTNKLNAATTHAREFLQKTSVIFITLGSAFVYSLNGNVVANCHRQDSRLFERRLISVEEASQSIQKIVALLRDMNRDIRIVFTVSPIRHLGDGAHGNNLSKATVLLAINNALEKVDAEYFPSYEIVMDELRDYRFYSDDTIHLSKSAEEYIFERMVETYCDSTTRENTAKVEKFLKMANHRIQDENSPATQELKKKLASQAAELERQITGLKLG